MTMKNDAKFEEENWLAVSKLTPQFDKFWPEHLNVSKICNLMDSFWPKYIMFELKNYRKGMFDGTEDDAKFEVKLTWTFKNDRNLAKFHRLKNSDFILESKMVELNQNKNSKQLDWPDAVKNLYFTLEINE